MRGPLFDLAVAESGDAGHFIPFPLPVEGGCPKGRGLAEGKRERSQPPALRATSFQRKEGEVVKAIYPLPVEGGSQANESRLSGIVILYSERRFFSMRRTMPIASSAPAH